MPKTDPKPFIIGGVEIPKGSRKHVEIELPSFYGSPANLNAYVFRGKKDGPTLFISAAIHGDELNGIEIIRRIRQMHLLKSLRGTIIFVPVVNMYGVMNHSRYLPDRRDLNRSFPGSAKGSLTSRVAYTFYQEIVQLCDFGIDLHTASIHKTNLPQIRANIKDCDTLGLAKAFGAPVILHSELRDGSLREVACEKNVSMLLYEAGEALRLDEKAIKIGVRGIINVLRTLEMLPKPSHRKQSKQSIITHKSSWIRALESGMIYTLKDLGTTVSKGDVIAHIYEFFEDHKYEVIAPFDGIIIGKSEIPLVHEGDAVFHIASFANLEHAEKSLEDYQELDDTIIAENL